MIRENIENKISSLEIGLMQLQVLKLYSPIGLVSKKRTGALRMDANILLCNTLEAFMQMM